MAHTPRTGRALKSSGSVAVPKRSLIKTAITSTVAAIASFCVAASCVLASDHSPLAEIAASGPETMLVKSLQEIAESRMDSALNGIEDLLKTNPNFRLAHLIKGDLLLARSRPISDLGNPAGAPQEHIADLREEARVRVQRHREPVPRNMTPKYLLQMQPEQKYAIIADTDKSRLYIFRNVGGKPRYVADYYISSGKNGSRKIREGDKKTPLGVYFVTANLPREKLTDFYGRGAFPINYPNEWDKRHGRSGFGIWLHGTPSDTYSRPPRASDGCVVLANQDLDRISETLQVGVTPVIISDGIEWVDPVDISGLRDKLGSHLESWRRAWENGNIEAYIGNYGRDFSTGSQNLAEWSRHKRQVNANKNWIKVGISNVGMFLYPGRDDLVVVNFDQEYSSNNLSNRMRKRQYWMKEHKNGPWKIIYESTA
ncbi:L,D-transpeptidase family protein [Nitrosovibrio tenuis]|uniref:Murein L,D-transpeptidase YafK n=1 Tax=Nitrosovibrio tenuis TaxID=1233 RepID=A0A1H7MNT2_9PROT|nr:L,D-transpeptidase family protein [Nitrosovibrio tenuis]SEL12834.1 Murein L,D-transpeptidase YafK [Nitrosovibrio tenuis]